LAEHAETVKPNSAQDPRDWKKKASTDFKEDEPLAKTAREGDGSWLMADG